MELAYDLVVNHLPISARCIMELGLLGKHVLDVVNMKTRRQGWKAISEAKGASQETGIALAAMVNGIYVDAGSRAVRVHCSTGARNVSATE